MEVDDQQDVERLIGTEYVIPFIRHIHITRSQPWQIDLLPRIGFGNVQSLTVTEPLSCFMDDPILSILCHIFSSVVTLRVQVGTLAYDNSAELVRFICAFSHLRTLCVFGNLSVDLPLPTSLNLSTHLRHLILNGGRDATHLLEWFISLQDRPALRTLDLGGVDEADFNAIVRMCSLLEDTLESLSFVLYRYRYGGALSVLIVNDLIDLRCMGLEMRCQMHLGRIRSLQIRPRARHGLIRQLTRMLSRISSIRMDEIVLELHPLFNCELNSLEWQAMDTVLQQPTFSWLSKFEILFLTATTTPSQLPAEEQFQFFVDNLPQCNASGILSIRLSEIPS